MLRRAFFGVVGALVGMKVGATNGVKRLYRKRRLGEMSRLSLHSKPEVGPISLECPCGNPLKLWRLENGTWVMGSEEMCSCIVSCEEKHPDRKKASDPITLEEIGFNQHRQWVDGGGDLVSQARFHESDIEWFRKAEKKRRAQRDHVEQMEALGKIMVAFLESVEDGTFVRAG